MAFLAPALSARTPSLAATGATVTTVTGVVTVSIPCTATSTASSTVHPTPQRNGSPSTVSSWGPNFCLSLLVCIRSLIPWSAWSR